MGNIGLNNLNLSNFQLLKITARLYDVINSKLFQIYHLHNLLYLPWYTFIHPGQLKKLYRF